MKTRSTSATESQELSVLSFGYEEISEFAHWGRGSRDVYILHYVLEGEGYFNGKRVKRGEGFYITPYKSHEYHSSEDMPWRYFWIILSGNQVDCICKKHICISDEGIFRYGFTHELIDISSRLFSGREPISEPLALSYFFLILSYHCDSDTAKGNAYVDKAKGYIRLNLHLAPSVTEIARELRISDRYLYNLFIREESISPKQYISQERLRVAKQMLRSGEYSIGEVARSVGFSDPLAFSRFFSNQVGLSPSRYKVNKKISETF